MNPIAILIIVIIIGVFAYYIIKNEIKKAIVKDRLSILLEQFVVVDVETTGLNPEIHETIELGAIKVHRDSNTHESMQALVKIEGKIPKKIIQLGRNYR